MRIFDRCRHEVTAEPGNVVLIRWYLFRTRWLTICLHHFLKNDTWPPHNHEYDSISVILRGKYVEFVRAPFDVDRWVWRRRWIPARRRAFEFHRVVIAEEYEGKVWTLFFQFRQRDATYPVGYSLGRDYRRGFVSQAEYDAHRGRKPEVIQFAGFLLPKVTVLT